MTSAHRLRHRRATRFLALGLAITIAPVALSAPGDITQLSAPLLGSDPPQAQDIGSFDASVATQTGAATYSFSVKVPPGRGPVPAVSFRYSSQAPIYGSNLGAGWSFDLPEVRYDTSRARLRYAHYAGTTDPEWNDEPYISTLSGGRPLVNVTGDALLPGAFATYRAKNDSQWLIYHRFHLPSSAAWIGQAPDGGTSYFGEAAFIDNQMSASVSTDALVRVRAPLTRQSDQFGNVTVFSTAGTLRRRQAGRRTRHSSMHLLARYSR